MEKVDNPSQIKSAERETVLSDFQYSGLNKYIFDFSKDMILSILLAEGKVARTVRQGKKFIDEIERKKLELRAITLAPKYLKRLVEMGFPEEEIDFEIHKKEIKKLLG